MEVVGYLEECLLPLALRGTACKQEATDPQVFGFPLWLGDQEISGLLYPIVKKAIACIELPCFDLLTQRCMEFVPEGLSALGRKRLLWAEIVSRLIIIRNRNDQA